MSGLSPLTLFQSNSKELMIAETYSRKGSKKLAKPKVFVALSSSLARFSSFIKSRSYSRTGKKRGKPTTITVEVSSSPVTPNPWNIPNYTTSICTGVNDSAVSIPDEVQPDVLGSPFALTLSTGTVQLTSSSASTGATINAVPMEIMRDIMEFLEPMDVICFGLAQKRIWESAKNHLYMQGLYPARFILTDRFGRYIGRPTVYVNLPERLKTWMSPRVLFNYSSPRIFVENQGRANHMMLYFRMVERELAKHYFPPTCIDLSEYYRPVWVLPECLGLFERWVHMGVHDHKSCIFCLQGMYGMLSTRSEESRISSYGFDFIKRFLQAILSAFKNH